MGSIAAFNSSLPPRRGKIGEFQYSGTPMESELAHGSAVAGPRFGLSPGAFA
jgi:hypothetical protein